MQPGGRDGPHAGRRAGPRHRRPGGRSGQVDVPLRYAVVREGVDPKTIVTKFRRFPVPMPPGETNVAFTDIEEDLSFPLPSLNELQAYVVYVGFDDVGDRSAASRSPRKKKLPARALTAPVKRVALSVELAEVVDALGDELVGDLALDVRRRRTFSAAATAASAAAARTSATACASAWAILVSAILVRRATNSSILALASTRHPLGFRLGAGDDGGGLAARPRPACADIRRAAPALPP